MNILLIAFEFPPLSRGGVYRPLAFAKYLPLFGINPIVITLAESTYKEVYSEYSIDTGLKKMIPEKTTLIEIEAEKLQQISGIKKFISIYFSIHGNEVNQWKKNFYKAVDDVVKKYKPAAILATVPPFSILPLVSNISSRYKLPLVLDFRDAWSQWRSVPYGSILHYKRTVAFEKKYLLFADAIITTSDQTLNDFKQIHPEIPANKFHCILNGYDGKLLKWQPLDIAKEVFTIGYVGSFYFSPLARLQMLKPWWKKRGHRMLQFIPHKQDWLYRSPYFFFKTLQRLNKEQPAIGKKIIIKFAGKKPDWLPGMIAEFELTNQVFFVGELSNRESLLFQQQCDALLITSAKQLNGKGDYSIAGKTFEYFQVQRPIIAFVCKGAQKDILIKSGASVICDPDSSKDSAAHLHDFFSGSLKPKPNTEFLLSLSREKLTEKVAQIIKKTVYDNA